MPAIRFRVTGITEIDYIRSLWEELNQYHQDKNTRFRKHYERMGFDERKSHFCMLSESGLLRLDLAADTANGQYVGYCVSSISEKNTGEIESLFITATYRSCGIGTALVTRCLTWMDSCGVVQKRALVSTGNKEARQFYQKFSFFPRMTVLEQTESPVQ